MSDETVIIRNWVLDEPFEIVRAGDGGDGRTVEGLIAPYDVEIETQELRNGQFKRIRELIRQGAFRQSINRRGDRIPLQLYHPDPRNPFADQNIVGHSVSDGWRDDTRGQRATFRVLNTARGDEALEYIRTNMVSSLSIHADIIRTNPKYATGKLPLMERTELALKGVALVPIGAYAQAGVEAVREHVDIHDPAQAPRLAALNEFLDNLRTRRV